MLEALRWKFQPEHPWTQELLLTEGTVEVYSNWGDTYWEINCSVVQEIPGNKGIFEIKGGDNKLGKLITQVRNEIKSK